ncbi:MAG: tRNA(adenine34) deaminase [Thermovirga sp.]|nr:tRNA(adenine34) deaminase [Thermovirga sp.]
MDDTLKRMMRRAIELAEEGASQGEVPVGAVVARNGEVVGEGYNRTIQMQDPTAHAEILALREAARKVGTWKLNDCDLFVTLEPCPMCAGALVLARIRHVYFGAFDPKWGACGTLYDIPEDGRLNHNCKISGGILEQECAKILQGFFEKLRA